MRPDMHLDMDMTVVADVLRWANAHAGQALTVWLTGAFHGFSQAAAPMAVTAAWQGAALACGLALCLRLAPRASAAHRFLLWSAGFAALVTLPFLPLLLNYSAAASRAVGGLSASVAAAGTRPWLQLDIRWSLGIGALWIAASALRAVDLGVHALRLRRLWKSAIPVDVDDSVFSQIAISRLGLRGRRPVEACTTKDLERPSVIGFLAPRILIPDWLYVRLTREELEQVVLHEAEHLRRRDDWTNLAQKFCLVLFPLNPALAWIERRLCREREMACDDGVVRATQAPRAYAACLASLAERGHERILERRAHALSLGAWQRRPELVDRVHRILRQNPGLSPLATHALLGALASGLVFGTVEFARCPQLIAFVPERSAEAAQQPAATSAQAAPARLLNAAYKQDLMKRSAQTRKTLVRADSKPADPDQASEALAELPARASQQVLLKAEMTGPETDAGRRQTAQAQEWIVFTTWEQVETLEQAAEKTADTNTGVSAGQASGEANGQPDNKTTSRITVTRLILRVYPVSTLSGRQAAVPIRNGWLVIEL